MFAWSCAKNNNAPSLLIAQSERLNGVLSQLAENSGDFLDSIGVSYADKSLCINIAFADTAVNIDKINDALVQFVMAQYMKNHIGPNLEEILNTLTKEEGKMVVTLSGNGIEKKYEISAKRAKDLARLKPMELNFSAAKESFTDLMAARTDIWLPIADRQKAKVSAPVEFGIEHGFAQYTFTFDQASAYHSLKQSYLNGRFQPAVKEAFIKLGDCRPIVQELMESFGIEGYRFVFANKKDNKILRSVITWSMI